MGNVGSIIWFRSGSSKEACPYCEAVHCHRAWCFTTNCDVRYAFEAATGENALTAGDVLILHSLGAIW